MICTDSESSLLEKLEDTIFPILLHAAENKSTLEDAAKSYGIPYVSLKEILKQIDLAHNNAIRQKNQEMVIKIKQITLEIIATVEAMTAGRRF